jgi:hypothetical protein
MEGAIFDRAIFDRAIEHLGTCYRTVLHTTANQRKDGEASQSLEAPSPGLLACLLAA